MGPLIELWREILDSKRVQVPQSSASRLISFQMIAMRYLWVVIYICETNSEVNYSIEAGWLNRKNAQVLCDHNIPLQLNEKFSQSTRPSLLYRDGMLGTKEK